MNSSSQESRASKPWPERLRTNAARRFKNTKSGMWLVHQVIVRLSKRWRRLCAAHLCKRVPLPGQPTDASVDAA